MKRKRRQTDKKKKNRQTNKEQTVERDHSGIIFASFYTIIKKQNGSYLFIGAKLMPYHQRKKFHIGHTFHLAPKKVFWWVGEK